MPLPSFDRLDHGGVIFQHLDRVGREVGEVFKKEYQDGKLKGALPSSKVQNFWAAVLWLETIMVPYLKIDYLEKSRQLKAKYYRAWKEKDLDTAFLAINELAQILMLEAASKGFLLREATTNQEWMVEKENDKNASSEYKE